MKYLQEQNHPVCVQNPQQTGYKDNSLDQL